MLEIWGDAGDLLTSDCGARLFKSFEFGNGSRMSDEKLVVPEFKYLQNKKWQKKAVKSARIKKNIYCFTVFISLS